MQVGILQKLKNYHLSEEKLPFLKDETDLVLKNLICHFYHCIEDIIYLICGNTVTQTPTAQPVSKQMLLSFVL